MFLFDTDAITNLLKKIPSKKLVDNISKLDKSEQYVSSITIGEIVYGAFKSKNQEFHLNNLENILLPSVNILDFDVSAAFIYGRIRSELEKNEDTISNTDLQIASIAISNNLTLITGNIRHFQRIKDLQIENWLT
ncbi:MAG: PIN domain-containing protein [Actinomycetota bacterium]|nr:PIN domain-containing protein [Actinomycetota bacterium]